MALDDAILSESAEDSLILRFYHWSGRGCTFGISQKHGDVVAQLRARGWNDVSPVRRPSGGGIVFHDGDLTFSLVFPWDRALAPEAVYKNIHRGVHVELKASGIMTRLHSPPQKPAGIAAACFARAEPMDLIGEDGGKILGGALRKKAGRGLYQGSLQMAGGAARGVLENLIAAAVAREFGRAPSREIDARWSVSARELRTWYDSPRWNERR